MFIFKAALVYIYAIFYCLANLLASDTDTCLYLISDLLPTKIRTLIMDKLLRFLIFNLEFISTIALRSKMIVCH